MTFEVIAFRAGAVVMLLLCAAACGCAAQGPANARQSAPLPWWVASPSAPLPKGFPAPGPADGIVIKQYPAYRAARVASTPGEQTPNGMFYPLFNHIEKNHVAMSSPVEISYDPPADAGATADAPPAQSMAFIYGDPSIGSAGTDGTVQVIDVPAMTVVSVGITGAYTNERFEKAYVQLTGWLAGHRAYEAAGRPRYLAYTSPFVLPFMRYGEVQIPVRAVMAGPTAH